MYEVPAVQIETEQRSDSWTKIETERPGSWVARLQTNPNVWEVGRTEAEAIGKLILTIRTQPEGKWAVGVQARIVRQPENQNVSLMGAHVFIEGIEGGFAEVVTLPTKKHLAGGRGTVPLSCLGPLE